MTQFSLVDDLQAGSINYAEAQRRGRKKAGFKGSGLGKHAQIDNRHIDRAILLSTSLLSIYSPPLLKSRRFLTQDIAIQQHRSMRILYKNGRACHIGE
jgi:hypothetical protein